MLITKTYEPKQNLICYIYYCDCLHLLNAHPLSYNIQYEPVNLIGSWQPILYFICSRLLVTFVFCTCSLKSNFWRLMFLTTHTHWNTKSNSITHDVKFLWIHLWQYSQKWRITKKHSLKWDERSNCIQTIHNLNKCN